MKTVKVSSRDFEAHGIDDLEQTTSLETVAKKDTQMEQDLRRILEQNLQDVFEKAMEVFSKKLGAEHEPQANDWAAELESHYEKLKQLLESAEIVLTVRKDTQAEIPEIIGNVSVRGIPENASPESFSAFSAAKLYKTLSFGKKNIAHELEKIYKLLNETFRFLSHCLSDFGNRLSLDKTKIVVSRLMDLFREMEKLSALMKVFPKKQKHQTCRFRKLLKTKPRLCDGTYGSLPTVYFICMRIREATPDRCFHIKTSKNLGRIC